MASNGGQGRSSMRPSMGLALAQDDEAEARIKARLAQVKGPSAAAASGNWVDWGGMAERLGQPFNVTSIPLNKLEQMRRDPMIAFGLAFVKLPLIRARWHIESEDPQRAAFVDHCLRRIYGRLILGWTNCLDYGYAGIVKNFEYDQPDWKYIDKDDPEEPKRMVWDSSTKALVWKPFLPLNPRISKPAWTKEGEFSGIHYNKGSQNAADYFYFEPQGSKDDDPEIPLPWALWAINEKDSVFGSFWGYPRTGYAYRYWWAYWYRFGLADRAFEKWADPPVEVYHPTDVGLDSSGNRVDYTSEALALAEKLRSGANVALPSDVIETIDGRVTSVRKWEVRQQDSKVNFDALNQAFEYLDVQKVRAMMVPEQALMEGKGGTSSRNVAGEMGDLLMQSQALIMEELDDAINRYLIPQLLEVNFGSGGASCKKVTTGFDPTDMDTMRTLVQVVGQSDPSKLPVDFREILKEHMGVPVLSPERIKAELDAQAAAAEETAPAATPASSTAQTAGVTQQGFYYGPRERVELSAPVVVRTVDELPVEVEGAVAYFSQEERTLYVLRGVETEAIGDYMARLADQGPVVLAEDGQETGG